MTTTTRPNQRYLSAVYLYECASEDVDNGHLEAARLRARTADVLLEQPTSLRREVDLAMMPVGVETDDACQRGLRWARLTYGKAGSPYVTPAEVAMAEAILDVCAAIGDLRGDL
jgi:hypothetical protein